MASQSRMVTYQCTYLAQVMMQAQGDIFCRRNIHVSKNGFTMQVSFMQKRIVDPFNSLTRLVRPRAGQYHGGFEIEFRGLGKNHAFISNSFFGRLFWKRHRRLYISIVYTLRCSCCRIIEPILRNSEKILSSNPQKAQHFITEQKTHKTLKTTINGATL